MERLTQTEAGAVTDEPEVRGPHLGTWPDRAAFGRSLAEDSGLIDYVWQIPQVIRPYVRLDYEAVARDICRAGELRIVETDDGIQVYESPRR